MEAVKPGATKYNNNKDEQKGIVETDKKNQSSKSQSRMKTGSEIEQDGKGHMGEWHTGSACIEQKCVVRTG